MGQLPAGAISLVETVDDARAFSPGDPDNLAWITQTTLSVDDTAEIVAALRARFPNIVGPHKEDICYATTNRQEAVKSIAARCEIVFVVGAPNSSNSKRLVEVARSGGAQRSFLVQSVADIDWHSLEGVQTVGLTAGASAPESLVTGVIDAFKARYDVTLRLEETAVENVHFKLPRLLTDDAA
jgi:4-hydroxy-3-methylbut-2-enyl diphosphate reductase